MTVGPFRVNVSPVNVEPNLDPCYGLAVEFYPATFNTWSVVEIRASWRNRFRLVHLVWCWPSAAESS